MATTIKIEPEDTEQSLLPSRRIIDALRELNGKSALSAILAKPSDERESETRLPPTRFITSEIIPSAEHAEIYEDLCAARDQALKRSEELRSTVEYLVARALSRRDDRNQGQVDRLRIDERGIEGVINPSLLGEEAQLKQIVKDLETLDTEEGYGADEVDVPQELEVLLDPLSFDGEVSVSQLQKPDETPVTAKPKKSEIISLSE